MTYLPNWERLPDAIERVMGATGRSKPEVQTEICRAIADGAIKIRGKLAEHAKHLVADAVVEGVHFDIPPEMKPEDLDWKNSRPVKPWVVRPGAVKLPGLWKLEWIEVFRSDVTDVLCSSETAGDSVRRVSRKANVKRKSQPAFDRAEAVIKELYPQGVPDQATEPNKKLCRRVVAKLKEKRLPNVSNDTILRAAGRRK
jgi:hypothetical protein